MRNFVLGLIVGLALAIFGYKPYQIESEYLHNIKTGLVSEPITNCVMTVGVERI
jgi:hypothetical protein